MKLTDQEQVILKAIGHRVVEIAQVIKAVGYPKATVKKVLIALSIKGVVSLHRHDWPQSLTPEQRKFMVKIGSNYYNAVSVRERNPMEKSKGKTALRKTGKALKGFAQGALSAASQIFGAGATALNPVRRKVRNKYIDLVIKGQAKKTPQGWKIGRKTFEQGRGTVSVSSGYYLDRATGLVYTKRERNKARRNAGHKDSDHPIEVTKHWRAGPPGYLTPWQRAHHAGQHDLFAHGIKPAKKRNPKKRVKRNAAIAVSAAKTAKRRPAAVGKAPRKAAAKARVRSMAKTRKRAVKGVASKPLKKSSRAGKRRNTQRIVNNAKIVNKRSNPSAESIRREFAGSVNGERDLFFPKGTPAGKLAKLGKLVSITTKAGTIKPVHGTAWLCADTRGKLHIGSTSNAPLIDGPVRNFGHVTKLEYESSKPHLGYKGPIIWFHRVGEENGIRPTLLADGKGGLLFRGGNYRLTSRGIEN